MITKRPSLPKTPWPTRTEPTPFSDLKALGGSSEASAASVSIVGAVTSRDPPAGTKRLENPKTKRAYEMLFLTLADHRGGRVRAQLIGKKAAKCAEAIEAAQRASGEKRVVVGLVGVKAGDRRRGDPKAPGDAPAVWDPVDPYDFGDPRGRLRGAGCELTSCMMLRNCHSSNCERGGPVRKKLAQSPLFFSNCVGHPIGPSELANFSKIRPAE